MRGFFIFGGVFMSIEAFDFPDDGYLVMEYPSLDIRTVGMVLGRICRFAGNCKTFWLVLMHSLVVSYLVPKQAAIHALLHDAGEIYVGDIPSPFKSFLISEFEDSALRSIYKQLCLPFPSPENRRIVKAADIRSRIGEVWTVGHASLKVLSEFRTRDLVVEKLILEMLDSYDFGSVLNPDGKYVSLFLDLFHKLHP
jgi:hypothetical protein